MTSYVTTVIDTRGVATVTLDNPEKHNAFDDKIIAELTEAFAHVDSDPAARVMVSSAFLMALLAGLAVVAVVTASTVFSATFSMPLSAARTASIALACTRGLPATFRTAIQASLCTIDMANDSLFAVYICARIMARPTSL